VPDTIFIAVGIVPLLGAVAWGYLHLRKVREFAAVEKEEERELIGA
jgi:hypothetical protein